MVWALFCFLLASAYLAEAQTGETCDEESAILINPDDCQSYWLCSRTGSSLLNWWPGGCPDGFIADVDDGCIEGTCDEVVVPPPPPILPPPPVGPSDSFDCTAAGAAYGTRGFGDPLDCRYYWWCWVVNGEWAPKVYKCPEGQMWKQHGESCWSGPCLR